MVRRRKRQPQGGPGQGGPSQQGQPDPAWGSRPELAQAPHIQQSVPVQTPSAALTEAQPKGKGKCKGKGKGKGLAPQQTAPTPSAAAAAPATAASVPAETTEAKPGKKKQKGKKEAQQPEQPATTPTPPTPSAAESDVEEFDYFDHYTKAMGNEVQLYMYELSYGCAESLSFLLVGKQMDGIWHTSIVVFGKEYYFGSDGILTYSPGETDFGQPPDKIISLGRTYKTAINLDNYLDTLKVGKYTSKSYSLVKLNCNNFTNELSKFLVGRGIPENILNLPRDLITGGCTRFSQAVAVSTTFNSTIKTFQSLFINNEEAKKQKNEGPSWLQIGATAANLIAAATDYSSSSSEEKPNQNRAVPWGFLGSNSLHD